MKLDTALNAIDRALDDILEAEIKNIFGNMGPASDQTMQLDIGFDRLITFETLVHDVAKRKFKP